MSKRRAVVRILQILILVCLCLLLVGVVKYGPQLAGRSETTLSQMGSRGSEVRNIQTRLKNWGYYTGSVDGVYGSKTRSAVLKFQRKNNLRADGVAGPATLYALGLPIGGGSGNGSGGYGKYSNSDYHLLARVISAEARGEPFTGQVAVGAVVLNRVESPSFPDTIAGVIYQPGAFSCIDDGQFNTPVADSAYRAAQNALNGWDPTNGSLYYYNPDTAQSSWIRKRPILLRIGDHVFCK